MPSFGYGGFGAGGTSMADRIGPSYSDYGYGRGASPAFGYFASGPSGHPELGGGGGAVSVGGGGGGGAVGLPPSRWAGINEGGMPVGRSGGGGLWAADLGGGTIPASGQASPARRAPSGVGFWDWLTGTPTGFLGQALSGMAIQRSANPSAANIGGSVANVVPSLINPFLGLANTLIGAGTKYFGENYNPRYGFGPPSFAASYTLPAPSPAPQPALSGSGGGWFGGGSGWTIDEVTPAF